jgi:hypothetical protein
VTAPRQLFGIGEVHPYLTAKLIKGGLDGQVWKYPENRWLIVVKGAEPLALPGNYRQADAAVCAFVRGERKRRGKGGRG